MAVRITRKDKSAGELRQEAARCRDGKAARRMLAIALVLDGVDRKTAAENCGMDRQTLRDWAHRYNAEGVSGLFNCRPPDPPCLLSAAQKEELAEMVRAGPDPETDAGHVTDIQLLPGRALHLFFDPHTLRRRGIAKPPRAPENIGKCV